MREPKRALELRQPQGRRVVDDREVWLRRIEDRVIGLGRCGAAEAEVFSGAGAGV